ncbi:MAG TPA: A/G-specific adenine glycosylase [Hypericibacter adhaerens]|jgi:A/G-specific adenine glycosylase|nr:A/G-specific adenine glycosylase [Hypericibacter adhaerens]HWA42639.1 A/G-specific adenine glycosylase [Hypericibacter adhaerens]
MPRDHAPSRSAADAGDARTRQTAPALLAWYDRHRRDLPWRARPGERPDPYHVWLSEIMLQQTTVATVGPYYARFLQRWPTVAALAAADLDAVLHAWQGLGYYARARNLHRCAKAVAGEHGGRFPETEEGLLTLPGIGGYTAAAVAAIAFGAKATPVDGNIERVVARLFALETPLPASKPELRRLAGLLTPETRAGDFAQAMMDLGATLCRPKAPLCLACPLTAFCAARAAGIAETLPRRSPKRARPQKHGVVFWIRCPDGAVLLRRRAEEGLLGGLMEFPSTDWREESWSVSAAIKAAPVKADWQALPGVVEHGFTHFDIDLTLLTGEVPARTKLEGVWVKPEDFAGQALPTLMKKVARHALAALQDAPAAPPETGRRKKKASS